MNIRQVEIFKAVMETGSVTEAARRLAIAQPSVSKHLKLLEARLGVTLFLRLKNRLVPTPEARALAEQTERLYSGLERLARFADDLKHQRQGEISVAAMPLVAHRWLPARLGRFLATRPDLPVSLPVRSSVWINEAVAAGRVDLGLGLTQGDEPGLQREPLLLLPLVCVLPAGHRLAARAELSPADLAGESLVTLANFDRWRLAVERVFEEHGVRPRRRVDTFTTDVACELVRQGLGLAVVDALTAVEHARGDLALCRFVPRECLTVHLLRPRHRPLSAVAEAFSAFLRREAAATQLGLDAQVAALGR